MPIEEIVVTVSPSAAAISGFADYFYLPDLPAPPVRDEAFLVPAVPQVIEEIIVSAKRTPVARATTGAGAFELGAALLLGLTAAEILRQISEQQLEEEFWDLMLLEPSPTPIEIPVRPVPGPADSEITVTTPTPIPQRAPQPVFFDPDLDPWEMIPVNPVILPSPAPVAPPTALPEPFATPLEIPQPAPTPTRRPFADPLGFPIGSPFLDPLPQPYATPTPTPRAQPTPLPLASPQPTPQPGASPFPTGLTQPQPDTLPLPEPLPEPQMVGRCPPCPKDKEQEEREKPRDVCYRKLVKEARYPDLDTEYEWAEIDCDTGREITQDNFLEDF